MLRYLETRPRIRVAHGSCEIVRVDGPRALIVDGELSEFCEAHVRPDRRRLAFTPHLLVGFGGHDSVDPLEVYYPPHLRFRVYRRVSELRGRSPKDCTLSDGWQREAINRRERWGSP